MENLLLILGILLIIGAFVYLFLGGRRKDEVSERLDRYALGVEEKKKERGKPCWAFSFPAGTWPISRGSA